MNESSEHYEDVSSAGLTHNTASGLSPGEILREARLAHDYSIEDLCAHTKLSAKTVNALEDNDFEALSQPVFARGYYRQCAKVLDIETERLMAAYTAWVGDAEPRPAPPTAVDVVPQDVTPQRWRALGLIGVLLLVLVAIGAVFLVLPNATLPDENSASDDGNTVVFSDPNDGSDDASGASASADSQTTPDVAGNDAAGNASGGGTVDAATDGVSSVPRSGGRNVNETLGMGAQGGDADQADSQPAEPAVAPNHLELTFTDRSWVDVRDANGNRLLTGIYESGETRAFDAPAPYKITLGYAPGVQVSIGGEPVDVASETTDNATARLTVEARDDSQG